MDKFKNVVTVTGGKLFIALFGQIDEDAEFPIPSIPSGELVFNFAEVSYINSLGIRSWVNYIKSLKGYSIALEECPPQIVRQLIMTPSFAQNAQVLSVFVPYSCDECSSKKNVLISKVEWKKNTNAVSEKIYCDKCKQDTLEIDGDSQHYF